MIVGPSSWLLTVAGLLLTGCGTYVSREHNFSSRSLRAASEASVMVSMRGSWTESDSEHVRIAVSSAPYTLRLAVRGRGVGVDNTLLESVRIVSTRGDTLMVSREARLMLLDDRRSELGTSLGSVPLGWERMTVLGTLVVGRGTTFEERREFAIALEPTFRERRSSRLWARLSGI